MVHLLSALSVFVVVDPQKKKIPRFDLAQKSGD